MISTSGGYLVIGQLLGAPIRVHWTAPLGALVFGRFELVPAFWLAFLGIILVHELGHAIIVRLVRARVRAVDLNGVGGLCHWSGNVSDIERAAIAWGGVLAQLGVFVVAIALVSIFGYPRTNFDLQLWQACTTANLWLVALNLIPIAPLDGAEAWRLVPLLRARRRQRRATARAKTARAHLRLLERTEADPRAVARADELARRMIATATRTPRKAGSER
jgi:Zn-dependent protease